MDAQEVAGFFVQVLEIIGILLIIGLGWLLVKMITKSRKRREQIDELEKEE